MGGCGAARLALALVALSAAACSAARPMGPGIAARVLGAARERSIGESAAGGMRLRGGWARGETKHRIKKYYRAGQDPKENRPSKEGSKRPCSGDKRLSGVERMHGIDVVLGAIRDATPHAPLFDPRYTVRRIGLRMNKWEDNRPFNLYQKTDVNVTLLKVAYRGLTQLIEPLLREGADINHVGMPKTGCPMHLIGLTPLSAAAHAGRAGAVVYLKSQGADLRCGRHEAPKDGFLFWKELTNAVATRRMEQKKAEDIKSRPWIGANRHGPGKRKTRHAKGARGGCR